MIVAGDDPVNESDPSGDITCGSIIPIGCGVATDVQNGISGAVKGVINAALSPVESKVRQTISGTKAAEAGSAAECGSASNTATLSGYAGLGAVASAFRLPDYVSVEVSGGVYGVVGGAVATVTRYGSVFVGPELGVGVPGVAGAVRAGWIDQSGEPGRNQLNGFVSSNSVTLAGYVPIPAVFDVVGPSAAEVWGNVGDGGWSSFSTEVGVGAGEGKNIALTWSYSFHVSDSGPSW